MARIEAGKLNHRVVIETPIKTTAPSGSVTVNSWKSITRRAIPAAFQPVSGGEVVRGVTIVSQATSLFQIRFARSLVVAPDQVTEFRLRWITGHSNPDQAPILNLVRVHDPDGLRNLIWLECRG